MANFSFIQYFQIDAEFKEKFLMIVKRKHKMEREIDIISFSCAHHTFKFQHTHKHTIIELGIDLLV